eukprot:12198096-Alexandrium_andersonii.AAC.1
MRRPWRGVGGWATQVLVLVVVFRDCREHAVAPATARPPRRWRKVDWPRKQSRGEAGAGNCSTGEGICSTR